MASRSVFCRFQVSGFHNWADAPKQYEYLKLKHRHVFHVEVHVPVNHDNRDVEFIHLKYMASCAMVNMGEPYLEAGVDFGGRSCEMLANDLYNKMKTAYGIVASKIIVSEDGENGATVEFD